VHLTFDESSLKVGSTKMEHMEYVIKNTCSHLNMKWNFCLTFSWILLFLCAWKCESANGYDSPMCHLFA